tara:strand:+ start:766 stop:1686 length:921 start_codon:yes stop_codon:yes gene_type:complete
MAKRPEPQDDAEVVRQMDLLKDVDPSDVSMPESSPEDKQKADLEAILARAAQRQAQEQAEIEARDKRIDTLAANMGQGESTEDMLARVRDQRNAIQQSVEEQAQQEIDAKPFFEFSFSHAAKLGMDAVKGVAEGAGAIGTAFKDLGTGIYNAATGKPIGEQPTVFDLPRMTEEEREGSIMAPRASDDLKPQAEVEAPPARTSQERAPITSGRQPISPQTFPDTRLPRTGFQRPAQPQPQQQQPPPPERIARMAEEAVERTGESIFTPEQAPELFKAVPAAGGQDGSQKIIELLETLPRRISEELKS